MIEILSIILFIILSISSSWYLWGSIKMMKTNDKIIYKIIAIISSFSCGMTLGTLSNLIKF